MANRAMAAKVERAKREAREAAHREMTKAPYIEKFARVEYSLAMVRRFERAAPRARRTMSPAQDSRPTIMGAWVIGEPGLISR